MGKEIRKYKNLFTTPEQQIEILKERGLIIEDEKSGVTEVKAKKYLEVVGYSRLNQYLYILEDKGAPKICLQKSSLNIYGEKIPKYVLPFKPGTRFADAIRFYEFDQKLRIVVLYAVTRIEVALATCWANVLSEKYGPHGYMKKENFFYNEKQESEGFNHSRALKKLFDHMDDLEYSRYHSGIKRYKEKYDEPVYPPIWTAVSIMSVGELVRWILHTKENDEEEKKERKIEKEIKNIFKDSEDVHKIDVNYPLKKNIPVKKTICRALNLPPSHALLKSFLENFRVLRNMCAHNTRLWNQEIDKRICVITTEPLFSAFNLTSKEKSYSEHSQNQSKKRKVFNASQVDGHLYNEFVILAHIMYALQGDHKWIMSLLELINTYLRKEELKYLGFLEEWEETAFWNKILEEYSTLNSHFNF